MSEANPPSRRWNLFARELEEVLGAPLRGVRLGQLDDQASIHREKVRRLRRSLDRPKSFPTLNPTEMEQVIRRYALTQEEILRLRAAILATAIEALLMDRLESNDDALRAAEQILPILVEALRSHDDDSESGGIGAFLRGRNTMHDDTELDRALESAVEAIDRATLALHLSHHVASATERIARARLARESFQQALDELHELAADDPALKEQPAWQEWLAEAEAGQHAAMARLTELGH